MKKKNKLHFENVHLILNNRVGSKLPANSSHLNRNKTLQSFMTELLQRMINWMGFLWHMTALSLWPHLFVASKEVLQSYSYRQFIITFKKKIKMTTLYF